jgi:hypothetical protein
MVTTGGGVSFQTPELTWSTLGCINLSTLATLTVTIKPIKANTKDF